MSDDCPHNLVSNGMCLTCFKHVSTPTVAVGSVRNSFVASPAFAEKIGATRVQELFDEEKLACVLDIDQTLLHSIEWNLSLLPPGALVVENGVSQCLICDEWGRRLGPRSEVSIPPDGVGVYHVLSFKANGLHRYLVSLRPGVLDFLLNMREDWHFFVYTKGQEGYANAVVSLLNRLAGFELIEEGRISTQTEAAVDGSKSLGRFFPGKTRPCVILDDTPSAWSSEDSGLVIPLEPYVVLAPSLAIAARIRLYSYSSAQVLSALGYVPKSFDGYAIGGDHNEISMAEPTIESIASAKDIPVVLPGTSRAVDTRPPQRPFCENGREFIPLPQAIRSSVTRAVAAAQLTACARVMGNIHRAVFQKVVEGADIKDLSPFLLEQRKAVFAGMLIVPLFMGYHSQRAAEVAVRICSFGGRICHHSECSDDDPPTHIVAVFNDEEIGAGSALSPLRQRFPHAKVVSLDWLMYSTWVFQALDTSLFPPPPRGEFMKWAERQGRVPLAPLAESFYKSQQPTQSPGSARPIPEDGHYKDI